MQRYVAFLRGINLGNRRLPMSRLRELFEELEFHEVETFIASGNVIFSCRKSKTAPIESRIAKHLESSLGYPVNTFIRTAEEVSAIAQSKPFPEDGKEGVTIHVCFLHEKFPASEARKLESIETNVDAFRVQGREYYWLCRIRTSESTVWKHPKMKEILLPDGTMRNMKSIRKLVMKHFPNTR